MKKRYDEIMDKIEVTAAMRQRILENLQASTREKPSRSPKARFTPLSKGLSIAACFVILLIGSLALPPLWKHEPPENLLTSPTPSITELASAQELSDAVHFEVTDVTGLPFEVEQQTYISYWDELAEIEYSGEGQTATFRKSLGQEDNSGIYQDYPQQQEISVASTTILLKGAADSFTLALWSEDGFSYSLSLSNGLSAVEWELLLTQNQL